MCERTLAVYATWMDVFVNTSGGPQKRRMVFWGARADASVYLRFYKRVAGIRLTYMELDAAALSLNIKCACVYRGAHLLAVNFVNSQMRGWMVSSALHKLFDFWWPWSIRLVQFNSNLMFVCRVSWIFIFYRLGRLPIVSAMDAWSLRPRFLFPPTFLDDGFDYWQSWQGVIPTGPSWFSPSLSILLFLYGSSFSSFTSVSTYIFT